MRRERERGREGERERGREGERERGREGGPGQWCRREQRVQREIEGRARARVD